ncbi:MAG: M14 family metallopeptidase, partial [Cyclobacteriaceae bacterium]
SPAEFLGYDLGSRFSVHHDVVDYYEHLSQTSDNVVLQKYGETYEKRPLLLAFVSTTENLENLEEIRKDNLRRAGLLAGSPSSKVSIVWLSYNVHGNEANSTEASMATIYDLLTTDKSTAWLENTVVVIDPCINPDGRDRYVNFYNQYGNFPYNPDAQSIEHSEPWPGGRQNHYLFDLNRDWAWQTQIESSARLAVYNQWLPQIHVDFHEQGYNSPYYFAPAAEPVHEMVTDWQRSFQTAIGRNNAKYFDENNWLYFTKQYFDLLYPSYGDSYPTFSGAIGMTYEQAGHGRGGLGVIKSDGDTLTLLDRLTHHKTTGLSTIEISSQNTDKMLSEFEKFFKTPVKGKYKSFILKSDNADKMKALQSWLDANGIKYGSATNKGSLSGYHYGSGRERSFTVNTNDLVVSVNQPKGVLAQILFEPKTKLSDSLTYDITAWAVPYIYGMEAFATTTALTVSENKSTPPSANFEVKEAYAVVFPWKSLDDAKFLAHLLKSKVKVRATSKEIKYQGQTFAPGSLIISKRDNPKIKDFDLAMTKYATAFGRQGTILTTGFMDGGPDLGSADISLLKAPRIAMFAGDGTSVTNVGATWYFMEQELNYPVSMIWVSEFSWIDMSNYDVLMMQEGRYSELTEGGMKKLSEWVSGGGKLILFQSAIGKFADSDFASVSRYNSDQEKAEMEDKDKERSESLKLARYENSERNYAKYNSSGAVFKVHLDNSHPLAFGYGNEYFSLHSTSARYGYLSSQNVGTIRSTSDHLSGFVGQYVMEDIAESMIFGVENKGSGQIVYLADNPL